MTEVLKVIGTYGAALRSARGNTPREVVTHAAPAVLFLLAAALVAGVLG